MNENGTATNRIAELTAAPENGVEAQPAPIDAEAELQKRLGEAKRRRAERCKEKIDAALKEYRCELKCTQPQATPEGGLFIPPRFEPFVLPLD